MIPVPPISVKFNDDERAKLKALAAALGWTESKVIRDSVAHVLHLIDHPDSQECPQIITMARLAQCHEADPALLLQHMKRISPSRKYWSLTGNQQH